METRFATAFFEAWNRHDVSAMAALSTKDAQAVPEQVSTDLCEGEYGK